MIGECIEGANERRESWRCSSVLVGVERQRSAHLARKKGWNLRLALGLGEETGKDAPKPGP